MTDIVDIVSKRLSDGRSISDSHVRDIIAEITHLRAKVAELEAWQEAAFDAHPNIDLDIESRAAYREADT